MGIDDVIEESTEKSITSRKDPGNVSVPEGAWKEIAVVSPDSIYIAATRSDKNDARCLVSLLENVLDEGVPGWSLNENQMDEIELTRDNIVEAKNL